MIHSNNRRELHDMTAKPGCIAETAGDAVREGHHNHDDDHLTQRRKSQTLQHPSTKPQGSCVDERESVSGSKMKAFEMEQELIDTLQSDLSLDDMEAEEAGLIQSANGGKHNRQTHTKKVCDYHRIENSNCHVIFPRFFYKSGFGMVGPHWFGPLCILTILTVASFMFTSMGYRKCGPLTGAMSIMFTAMISYNLINTSLRDPGLVILDRQSPPPEDPVPTDVEPDAGPPAAPHRRKPRWCWCDVCQAHQPPDAAHCPDCNVCIKGFDHHCVWMGVCIGRNNFKQFLRFNLSWLGYLAYCIVWVSLVGPLVSNKVRHAVSGEA